MNMREKIALAIHGELVAVIADEREPEERCFAAADAVLDAMREPTPEMIAAGRQKAIDQSYGTRFPSNDNIAALFAAMIDAAKGD